MTLNKNIQLFEEKYNYKLNDRQLKFLLFLHKVFNVKTVSGKTMRYTPAPFQINFHKDFFLANPSAPNRIYNKARGIGFSMMIMMELLVVAKKYNDMILPVVSYRAEAAKDLIAWGYWLAKNAAIDFGVVSDNAYSLKLDTNCEIRAIPGGNPDALRGIRTKCIVFDEFAHCDRQKELLLAGDRCLSEGGQRTIGSSPNGKSNLFWELWNRALNREILDLPYKTTVFDEEKFNPKVSIYEQIKNGLTPAVPWINLQKLEEARRQDFIGFMQENMADPQDESASFLSWDLIDRCAKPDLKMVNLDYITPNPLYMGVDVARNKDLTVITIMEKTEVGYIMRYLETFTNVDIPNQIDNIIAISERMRITGIRIDQTGMGLGLFEGCKRILGHKVKGYQFTKLEKERLAVNLRTKMQDGRVFIFDDPYLKKDLNMVRYDGLKSEHTNIGHADRFWSLALAVDDIFDTQIPAAFAKYSPRSSLDAEQRFRQLPTTMGGVAEHRKYQDIPREQNDTIIL